MTVIGNLCYQLEDLSPQYFYVIGLQNVTVKQNLNNQQVVYKLETNSETKIILMQTNKM